MILIQINNINYVCVCTQKLLIKPNGGKGITENYHRQWMNISYRTNGMLINQSHLKTGDVQVLYTINNKSQM